VADRSMTSSVRGGCVGCWKDRGRRHHGGRAGPRRPPRLETRTPNARARERHGRVRLRPPGRRATPHAHNDRIMPPPCRTARLDAWPELACHPVSAPCSCPFFFLSNRMGGTTRLCCVSFHSRTSDSFFFFFFFLYCSSCCCYGATPLR